MMKRPSLPLLLACHFLLFVHCGERDSQRLARVTFHVNPALMPDSAQIHIAGNLPVLGAWQPNKIALTRLDDSSWGRTFTFPAGSHLEYKFTRGAWQNEAVSAEGVVPANSVLEVRSDTTLTIRIASWKDVIHHVEGQITGAVAYHRQMPGEGLEPRDIIVWLPPSYSTAPDKRYPVLYMHDGQNVFDPRTSFIGADWQVDEVADSLIRAGRMREIILVGISNTDDRVEEYSDTAKGRAYMKFVVGKLKPFIDTNYRTMPEREHTATMGSSMGGLISFLLVWNYPQFFSQAGCLSPAFVYNDDSAIKLVRKEGSTRHDLRIYLDNGGIGLENSLQPGCDRMLVALQQEGFELGADLEWFQDAEADHSERAWAKRVWRPLVFMYGIHDRKADSAHEDEL